MFQRLRHSLLKWLFGISLSLLAKLSVEAINQLPWKVWGEDLNERTDKLDKKTADAVQQALNDGIDQFQKGFGA